MAPKVLVSDKLSETAVQIFRDRGIEVDFRPELGKDKDALAAVIGDYDGLAIRSATRVTPTILENAHKLKVIARAGIGTDNIDKDAASKKGVIVMNTPFGNMITTAEHAIAMMFAVARQIPEASASTHAGSGRSLSLWALSSPIKRLASLVQAILAGSYVTVRVVLK
jgi:D-3-phosphoglycerate dehydrogenase